MSDNCIKIKLSLLSIKTINQYSKIHLPPSSKIMLLSSSKPLFPSIAYYQTPSSEKNPTLVSDHTPQTHNTLTSLYIDRTPFFYWLLCLSSSLAHLQSYFIKVQVSTWKSYNTCNFITYKLLVSKSFLVLCNIGEEYIFLNVNIQSRAKIINWFEYCSHDMTWFKSL